MYYIKSEKGYWLHNARGYTNDKAKAGTFTFSDMDRMRLNLDGCTLEAVIN